MKDPGELASKLRRAEQCRWAQPNPQMNVTVCEILRLYARMPRALAFVALAVPSIFVAVCAYTPEYAFHA